MIRTMEKKRARPAGWALLGAGALVGLLAACGKDGDGLDDSCLLGFWTTQASQIFVGDSTFVYAHVLPGCGHETPIAWSSNTPDIATVRAANDTTAVVRGIAPGLARLTATTRNESAQHPVAIQVNAR